jgi:asparagine synthetase B (glutamine-hydrolysing)
MFPVCARPATCSAEGPDIPMQRNTVMDLSLANALYFGSRGIGLVRCAGGDGYVPYASKARVLLSGLGSDELLGGYGRHRNTFKCGSWPALIDEVRQRGPGGHEF